MLHTSKLLLWAINKYHDKLQQNCQKHKTVMLHMLDKFVH